MNGKGMKKAGPIPLPIIPLPTVGLCGLVSSASSCSSLRPNLRRTSCKFSESRHPPTRTKPCG